MIECLFSTKKVSINPFLFNASQNSSGIRVSAMLMFSSILFISDVLIAILFTPGAFKEN